MGIAKYIYRQASHELDKTHFTSDQVGLSINQIIEMLGKMPKGTTVAGIRRLPTTGLTLDTEVLLHNTIFKDGAEIKDNCSNMARAVGFGEGGELVQYNRENSLNLDEVVRKATEVMSVCYDPNPTQGKRT